MTSTLTPPPGPLTASLTLTDSPGGEEEGQNAVDDPGAFCALDAVEAFMRRFLAITDEQACVLALFTVHTYAFSAAESTPYIRVTANTAAAGKGHPRGTNILTPNGWEKIEDLHVGSQVIGSDGEPTLVLATYDRGELPVYRVTFNDRTSVVTDGEHLWSITAHGQHRKPQIHETAWIAENLHRRWEIPTVAPIQFKRRDLPIDPYVLGVMIGDGYLVRGLDFDTDEETAREVEKRLAPTFTLSRREGHYNILSGKGTGRLPGGAYKQHAFRLALDALGLVGKKAEGKFIPEMYLYASEEQRRDLLAGLMDTDGELSLNSSGTGMATAFSSASETLRDQVAFLVQSLGGIARKGFKAKPMYTYRGEKRMGQPSYRLRVHMDENPFRTRKGWRPLKNHRPKRIIKSVEPCGTAPVICLRVDATDSLYVTEECIVTHNTRVLEILEVLCENPWFTSRATGPAMVRRIAENSPTLLMDESDCLFSGGNQSQQMIRGVLNSGYRLGGKVAYAKGNTYEELDVFCPKAFAGIGDLPATVMSRSIPIVMKPKGPFDKVERLRQRDIKQEALVPKALARRFGAVNLKALTDSRPMIPEALDDRAADVWEPLLAIADVAGGDWPSRARLAAVSLCSERKRSGNTGWPFRLLTQVHAIFKQLDTDRLKTVTLLEALLADSEWQDIDQKGPLTAMMLADALRPFGVSVTKVRFGKQVAQGYLARDITRAVELLPESERAEEEK